MIITASLLLFLLYYYVSYYAHYTIILVLQFLFLYLFLTRAQTVQKQYFPPHILHEHFPLCQESLSSQLAEKDQTMEKWRKERDTLVAALEVQLQKLLSSQADKDKLIQQLRQNNTQPPQEVSMT